MWLIIVAFLCYKNYKRARAQTLFGLLWAFYTFLAVIAGWLAGSMIMISIAMMRYPEFIDFASQPGLTPTEVSAFLMERINPIVADIFMLFSGIGGYLFVRHRLIKKAAISQGTGGDKDGYS